MRRRFLVALALALTIAAPTLASADGWRGGHGWHGRGWHSGPRVFFGFGAPYYGWGPGWGWGSGWGPSWGWGPGWGWPPGYGRERIIEREPPVYVERDDSAEPPSSEPRDGYWYFCRSANAYYPDVAHCREAWIPVPPRSR